MPLLFTCRRCFVPACLALGALHALPALADKPAASASPVVLAAAQKIVLQHVVPSDVIKQMRWDRSTNLPAGVAQIVPLPAQNALSVTATLAGLAQVREIVNLLDIAPRQVHVKFLLASVSEAVLKAALGADGSVTGPPAARFLQTLTKQGAILYSTSLTTANNVNANWRFVLDSQYLAETFAFTPHINGDNSVTLALDAALPEVAGKREVHTLRTVQSGGTLVIVMPPARSNPDKQAVLLFVLPTVLR